MFSRRRTLLQPSSRRILVVGFALAGYVAGTLGFPIPQSTVQAITSAEKACGCCCPPVACAEVCCCAPLGSPRGDTQTKSTPTAVTWVHGMSARQCGGESTSWTQAPLALPAAEWTTWVYRWVFDHWLTPSICFTSDNSTAPPSPPPRPC